MSICNDGGKNTSTMSDHAERTMLVLHCQGEAQHVESKAGSDNNNRCSETSVTDGEMR